MICINFISNKKIFKRKIIIKKFISQILINFILAEMGFNFNSSGVLTNKDVAIHINSVDSTETSNNFYASVNYGIFGTDRRGNSIIINNNN